LIINDSIFVVNQTYYMAQTSYTPIRISLKICFLALLLLPAVNTAARAEDVLVINTSTIIPYNTCIEGLRQTLAAQSLQVVNIESDLDKGKELVSSIRERQYRLVVAVGPQASFLLAEEKFSAPKLFCMVLNPQRLIAKEKLYSGVSLNIPTAYQLQQIKKTFPERKRIGVFFSQGENKTLVDVLQKEAALHGQVMVGLPIASASDILPTIASKDFSIDILLMIPDEQINSQKIVEYIIKESLRRKIPVVGYNSWFAKNGAILSFIIDYRDVGVQTGTMAMKLLKQGAPSRAVIEAPARIRVSLDVKTAQKLDIQVSSAAIQQADEVMR
jgi:putative tryptophan/tyrosine transport system substrate-binding protein